MLPEGCTEEGQVVGRVASAAQQLPAGLRQPTHQPGAEVRPRLHPLRRHRLQQRVVEAGQGKALRRHGHQLEAGGPGRVLHKPKQLGSVVCGTGKGCGGRHLCLVCRPLKEGWRARAGASQLALRSPRKKCPKLVILRGSPGFSGSTMPTCGGSQARHRGQPARQQGKDWSAAMQASHCPHQKGYQTTGTVQLEKTGLRR